VDASKIQGLRERARKETALDLLLVTADATTFVLASMRLGLTKEDSLQMMTMAWDQFETELARSLNEESQKQEESP
jgi:hypothetical protein